MRMLIMLFMVTMPLVLLSNSFSKTVYNDVSVVKQNGTAVFSKSGSVGIPGRPGLPYRQLSFLIPEEADISTMEITLNYSADDTAIYNDYFVEPESPVFFGDTLEWPNPDDIVNERDVTVYNVNGFWPQSHVGGLSFSTYRSVKYGIIPFFPFRYNPVTGQLVEMKKVEITISYRSTSIVDYFVVPNTLNPVEKQTLTDPETKLLNGSTIQFLNDNMVPYSTSASSLQKDAYVIITTKALYLSTCIDGFTFNWNGCIDDFAFNKYQKDFDVYIVFEDSIIKILHSNNGDKVFEQNSGWGGGTGDTAAENIRSWLIEGMYDSQGKYTHERNARFEQMNIKFLLLIGDPNPDSGNVPMKKTYPRYKGTDTSNMMYPSDQYYAELSNDVNWDFDNDGKYGEREDLCVSDGENSEDNNCMMDYNPDISVGRIPYYGSTDDLCLILDKIVSYSQSSNSWGKNILLSMASADSHPWYVLGESIVEEVMEKEVRDNWSYYRIYENDPILIGSHILYPPGDETPQDNNGEDVNPSVNATRRALQNHNFGLFVWFGHGTSSGSDQIINNGLVSELDNSHPFFTFHATCNNGKPEDSHNIAYELLLKGGINSVANSRLSFRRCKFRVASGDYNDSGTDNEGMALRYVHGLIINNLSSGEALNKAKRYGILHSENIDHIFAKYVENIIGYNLYGDPSLRLLENPQEDSDNDGIRDDFDYCPKVNYVHNEKWPCKDDDGDYVINYYDNCRNYPNSGLDCINCLYEQTPDCCIQKDRNGDGIGDACDMDGDGIEDRDDDMVFYTVGAWLKEGDPDSKTLENYLSGSSHQIWLYSYEKGAEIGLPVLTGIKGSDETFLSRYYCYCGMNFDDHKQCNDNSSVCGPNHARPNAPAEGEENYNPRYGLDDQDKRIWEPANVKNTAYSYFGESEKNTKYTPDGGSLAEYGTGVREKRIKHFWDFQKQINIQAPVQGTDFDDYNELINSHFFPMAKISYAPVISESDRSVNGVEYLDYYERVNFDYFSNFRQIQDEEQFYKNTHSLAYGMGEKRNIDLVVEKGHFIIAKFFFKYLHKAFWQMMREYMPKPWDSGGYPFEQVSTHASQSNMYDSIIRPGNMLSADLKSGVMSFDAVDAPSGYQQIFKLGGRNAVYGNKEGEYRIEVEEKGGSFNTAAVFSNGVDLNSAAVLNVGGELYMAGNMTRMTQYSASLTALSIPDIDHGVFYEPVFVKISSPDGSAAMEVLPSLPETGRFINLFAIDSSIYFITESESGSVKIYLFNGSSAQNPWTLKLEHSFSSAFSLQNIVVKNGSAYFTSGDPSSGITKVYRYDGTDSVTEYASVPVEYDAAIRLFTNGDILTAVHINDLNGSGVPAWDILETGVTGHWVSVDLNGLDSELHGEDSCIVVEYSTLKGGQLKGVECEPFSGIDVGYYRENSRVLSVEGSGSTLFVGTEDAIKVYNISDYTSPSLISTYPAAYPVWDMEMIGTLLYVSDGNAISVLNIEDTSNIYLEKRLVTYDPANFLFSYTGPVYSGSGVPVSVGGTLRDTAQMKMFKGKLYAADGHGITVINIDNPEDPVVVSHIYTSGNVETFDISDEFIYLYDRAGLKIYYTGSLELFYADYDGVYCDDAVFRHHNGVWYAGCGNGLFTVELDTPENPWENDYVSFQGERISLEDSFTNKGLSFFPGDKEVIIKTVGTVPAPVCGNGLIESGEICEIGNSVNCESLNSNYINGTAYCNSTCDGYNENNCEEDDGWGSSSSGDNDDDDGW